jgi:hypothetical protein
MLKVILLRVVMLRVIVLNRFAECRGVIFYREKLKQHLLRNLSEKLLNFPMNFALLKDKLECL